MVALGGPVVTHPVQAEIMVSTVQSGPWPLDKGRPPQAFAASFYTVTLRLIAAACFAVSRASLPAILIFGFFLAEQSIEPRDLPSILLFAVAIPGCVAWLLARAATARVMLDQDRIVIEGWRRIEVPTAAVVGVEPWLLPLPAPGLWLRLTSGRRLRWGLAMADPTGVVAALENAGVIRPAARTHPTIIYAAERMRRSPGWLGNPVVKFVLFALGPTAVVFNADQYIAYGGTFGQYYLEGAIPYLRTFVIDWALVAFYLVLFASLWRAGAELVSWSAAFLSPARAGKVRAAAEYACLIGFYGGVPLLLAIRFMS
jgi:apolipoprotein N-acyltransferase